MMNKMQRAIATQLATEMEHKLAELTGIEYSVYFFPKPAPDYNADPMQLLLRIARALRLDYSDYTVKSRDQVTLDLRMVALVLLNEYSPRTTDSRIAHIMQIEYRKVNYSRERAQGLLKSGDESLTAKYLTAKTAVHQWIQEQSR